MDKKQFWTILESSITKSRGNRERLLDSLREELVKLGPPAIVKFQRELDARMDEAMTWPLWGAVYMLEGGCSDDMFEYFRALLVANGQEVFESVVADPDSLASTKLRFKGEDELELESLLYVPAEAYEKIAGGAPLPPRTSRRAEPVGTQWEESDLPELLPKIAKKLKRKAGKACPLQLGDIFRIPLPFELEGTAYAYFKVIGSVPDKEEGQHVIVQLFNYPPPNAEPPADWSRVPRVAMRYYEPFNDPNGRREVGKLRGWDDPDWNRKDAQVIAKVAVTEAEAALAETMRHAPYGHSFGWSMLAEDAQGSFDPSVWPTVAALKPKRTEIDVRIEGMSTEQIDAAADQLTAELSGISRRYWYLTGAAAVYIHKREFEKSLALLRIAERIMPLFWGVWLRKGQALYGLGRVAEANTAWQKAIETAPAKLKKIVPSSIDDRRNEIDTDFGRAPTKTEK